MFPKLIEVTSEERDLWKSVSWAYEAEDNPMGEEGLLLNRMRDVVEVTRWLAGGREQMIDARLKICDGLMDKIAEAWS